MSRSSLALKSFNTEEDGTQVAVFSAMHSSGPPRGTTLEFYVILRRPRYADEWAATIEFDQCTAKSMRAALERIGDWVQRADEALNLRDWDEQDSIPLGSSLR